MNSKVTPILTVLLVIVSFLAGSMYTRVRTMEDSEGETKGQTAQVTVAPQQEAPTPKILTEDEVAEIAEGGTAVKGNDGAKVTIVEFSEYLCPFCAEYVGFDAIPSRPIDEEKTYQQIIEQYVNTGQARYIFRDYPVHGDPAIAAAKAAYCAGDQDNYWQYHDALFNSQAELSSAEDIKTVLSGLANDLGLDSNQFEQCVNDDKYAQTVDDNFTLGKKVGVSGTPSFFINGQMLVGAQPFSAFKAVIEEELGK